MPRTHAGPPVLDAYRTTGSSPGRTVPTVHLLGPGAVGRAFLERLAGEEGVRLVAVTDRSGTLHDPDGLDPAAVAAWKVERTRLAEHPGASPWDAARALAHVRADLVVDATSTDPRRGGWDALLQRAVLDRGGALAFAAKDAPARRAHAWLAADPEGAAVGIDAVLGGAGEALRDELADLRADCVSVALAGSASTSLIVDALADGATFEEAVARARAEKLLETDPELDFQGRDAAVKLAVVVQALWGWRVAPAAIACDDVRSLSPADLRDRRARGWTTRLVARASRDGDLVVRYEALPPGDPLAVPRNRVAYRYERAGGDARLHVGTGLGADATARALLGDVRRLAVRWQTESRSGSRAGAPDASWPASAPRTPPPPAGRLTLLPTTRVAYLPEGFSLERGEWAEAGFVAFETFGPDDAPVAVVLGGISATRFPGDRADRVGWWSAQVGGGRALDTDRIRVVSLDWIGGDGDSTGPRSASDWTPGRQVTTADQARAVAVVLDTLGVPRAAALVGASYGGMVGLRFGALFPERVARICVLGASHESHPLATAVRSVQRRIIRLAREAGRAADGVGLARALGVTTYRSASEFLERFATGPEGGSPACFPVDAYLDVHARRFAGVHPEAYLCLSESLDLHRVDPAAIGVPLTVVAFDTDTLVPPSSARALVLAASGRRRLRVVSTKYGHDGFLKETAAVADVVRGALAAGLREVAS